MSFSQEPLSGEELAHTRHLVAEGACRALLERYAYAVDWKNWRGLEALFWPEASFDFGMWQGDRVGFIPWVTDLESNYSRRLHMLAVPRMAIGASKGTAEAGNTTVVRGPGEDGAIKDQVIFGRYQFDFECRAGEWRMSALRFLLHGMHALDATDEGGAPFFADGLEPSHAMFAQ